MKAVPETVDLNARIPGTMTHEPYESFSGLNRERGARYTRSPVVSQYSRGTVMPSSVGKPA